MHKRKAKGKKQWAAGSRQLRQESRAKTPRRQGNSDGKSKGKWQEAKGKESGWLHFSAAAGRAGNAGGQPRALCVRCGRQLNSVSAVNIAAVTHPDDIDDRPSVVDAVYNSVLADSDAPEARSAL